MCLSSLMTVDRKSQPYSGLDSNASHAGPYGLFHQSLPCLACLSPLIAGCDGLGDSLSGRDSPNHKASAQGVLEARFPHFWAVVLRRWVRWWEFMGVCKQDVQGRNSRNIHGKACPSHQGHLEAELRIQSL